MSNQISVFSLTKLYWNSGSGYFEVPGVTAINGPAVSRKFIDTTNMDSVQFTEGRPANLANPGVVSATLQWNPSNSIHAALARRTYTGSFVDTWQLQFSDTSASVYSFSGSVSDWSLKADNPADGILTADLKISVTSTLITD